MPKYWVKNYFAHGRFPEVGQKQKTEKNTPGTAGGPGGRDQMLVVKSKKNARKSAFFIKKIKITTIFFLLHISSSYSKILGKRIFTQSGSKAEDGEKREKKTEQW